MTFRSVLKTVAKVFLGLFALLPLLALLWLAWALWLNRHDDTLTPEAEVLLSYRPQELPDTENGYVMMVGFTAPAGSDWRALGAERIAHENKHIASANRWIEEGPVRFFKEAEAQKLKFSERGDYGAAAMFFKGADETALLAELQSLPQQEEHLKKLLADNAELISRYEAVQPIQAFSERVNPPWAMWVFPDYGDIAATRELLLAKLSLAALTGKRELLLDFLERDLAFWRMLISSDSSLYTAMIGTSSISQTLRLLRALLSQIDFSASELERLSHLLTPLSKEELSILRTLENETASGTNVFLFKKGESLLSDWTGWFLQWFFQPQASVNFYAERMQPWKELASMPTPEFAVRSSVVNTINRTKPFPYNELGILLVVMGTTHGYEDYFARRHDLAAALQLTRAQVELRIAGIDAGKNPEAVPEFLAQAGEEAMNPYTGKPFEWDEACRRLSFTPQSERYRASSEVTLADVPEQNAAACAAAIAAPLVSD